MNELATVGRVEQIKTLHAEIGGMVRATLDKAILVGQLLSEVKGELRHGEWLPWVEENLPFTGRTASSYMRLYERRNELKSENVSDLSSAYRMLTEPKEEKPVSGEWKDAHIDAFQIAELWDEDDRLVPALGHLLMGERTKAGAHETLLIFPSEIPNFYHIANIISFGRADHLSSYAEGSKKPVWSSKIGEFVHHALHRRYEEFEWITVPAKENAPYNHYLFHSHQDYVDKAILGKSDE